MNATNIYSNDFLDILFDGRNKEYGAYDLRRSQDRRLRNAVIGTASLALVIIGGYVINSRLMAADRHHSYTTVTQPPIAPTNIFKDEPPVVTPPPPVHQTTPPPAASSMRVTTPIITTEDVETEVPPNESIGNKTVGLTNTVGDDINGIDAPVGFKGGTGGVVEPPKGPDRDSTRTFVELMPSFPGGEAALAKFLQKNMRYPNMAVENGIQGKIFVQFVVDWQGNIKDIKTIGGHVGAGLEEEATRVVALMPKWNPGKQNGQTVSVQFNLPVTFHMN
jgi:protein TonB